jgi:hypothetical protein
MIALVEKLASFFGLQAAVVAFSLGLLAGTALCVPTGWVSYKTGHWLGHKEGVKETTKDGEIADLKRKLATAKSDLKNAEDASEWAKADAVSNAKLAQEQEERADGYAKALSLRGAPSLSALPPLVVADPRCSIVPDDLSWLRSRRSKRTGGQADPGRESAPAREPHRTRPSSPT